MTDDEVWESLKVGYKDFKEETHNGAPYKGLLSLMAYELGLVMASEGVPLDEELKEELIEHIRYQI